VNVRTELGTDVNVRTEHGTDVNVRTEHGTDVNVRTELGTDVNVRTEHGTDVNVRTEYGSDVNVRTEHGTNVNVRTELQGSQTLSNMTNEITKSGASVVEICILMGHYALYSCDSLLKFRYILSVPLQDSRYPAKRFSSWIS
jgi:hypothetical protein